VLFRSCKYEYDFIIIDAQAGSDEFAQIAMSNEISDEVIIVSEYDPMSAAGIERLKAIQRENLTYTRTWILLNKMIPDFAKAFSDFLEVAKYLPPIPWDADVVKAYARRKLALDLEFGNEYTLAIMKTLKILLGEDISNQIDNWAKQHSSLIREPIVIQYEDIERKLFVIKKLKSQYERKRYLLGTIINVCLILLFPAIIMALSPYLIKQLALFEKNPSIVAIAISILIALAVAVLSFNKFINKVITSETDNLTKDRMERQILVLEEQLKKLEILREADLETLIREKY
jgi:hypothetical protein